MVEFSPATRETGVRIPANATFVFNMNAIFYMWLCRENCCCYKHWWFSGRILACHAGDRGSIPRQCNLCFLHEFLYMIAIFYMWLCREKLPIQSLFFTCYREHWWFSGRILACHAGDRGSIPRQCNLCFLTWMQYFIYDCAGQIVDVTSIGGSVVEFSPATRETGVRFPANAIFVFNMNAIFYIWLCRVNCWRYKHWWFSGRILACHAGDRGSNLRQCYFCF